MNELQECCESIKKKDKSAEDYKSYSTKLNLSSKYDDFSKIRDDLDIDIKLNKINESKLKDSKLIDSILGPDSNTSKNENDAEAEDNPLETLGEGTNPVQPPKINSEASEETFENPDQVYAKKLQKVIDRWQQAQPKYKLGNVHYIVLAVTVLVICGLFALYQLFPICKVFSLGTYQVTWHTLFQILITILPALSAAFANISSMNISDYDQTLEGLSEEKKGVLKRSTKYRNALAWKEVCQGLTIITAFIAAITAIPS